MGNHEDGYLTGIDNLSMVIPRDTHVDYRVSHKNTGFFLLGLDR